MYIYIYIYIYICIYVYIYMYIYIYIYIYIYAAQREERRERDVPLHFPQAPGPETSKPRPHLPGDAMNSCPLFFQARQGPPKNPIRADRCAPPPQRRRPGLDLTGHGSFERSHRRLCKVEGSPALWVLHPRRLLSPQPPCPDCLCSGHGGLWEESSYSKKTLAPIWQEWQELGRRPKS